MPIKVIREMGSERVKTTPKEEAEAIRERQRQVEREIETPVAKKKWWRRSREKEYKALLRLYFPATSDKKLDYVARKLDLM